MGVTLERDEVTGEFGSKWVVRTFVTADKATLALSLRDDERGEHEQVDATAEHPFWLEGRGWVGAGSLRAGERLLRADGRWLRVERVEAKAGRRTVYNLEVEDFHTYVVGDLGAWVHNTCNPAELAKKAAQVICKLPNTNFKLLQCQECAQEMIQALRSAGIKGHELTVKANGGRGFIVSDLLSSGVPISENGLHKAVQIGEAVFDSLNKGGVARSLWESSLFAPRGVTVTSVPFLSPGGWLCALFNSFASCARSQRGT